MVDKAQAEKIAELLRTGVAAVELADPPEDLRPIALAKAVELASVDSGQGRQETNTALDGELGVSEGATAVQAIAKKFKLDSGVVARVVEIDGDDIHLISPRNALEETTRDAARQIAVVIAAARQASGLDDGSTPLAVIRARCDYHGVADSNFSRFMKDIPGTRITGTGQNRALVVNIQGFEAAAALVESFADRSAT
jgi:hypothetical protein